jgi:hypothetical protein
VGALLDFVPEISADGWLMLLNTYNLSLGIAQLSYFFVN